MKFFGGVMRNIEFRGKDIETGVWRYGFYSQFHNRPLVNEPNIHQIFELAEENSSPIILGNTSIGGLWFTINENTLGQYTGLKDKNGTKIYEGDIVRTSYKEVREYQGVKYDNKMNFIEKVIWSNDYNGWCLEIDNCGFKMYRRLNYCEEINKIKLADCEVIGNIYDNPELLEGL